MYDTALSGGHSMCDTALSGSCFMYDTARSGGHSMCDTALSGSCFMYDTALSGRCFMYDTALCPFYTCRENLVQLQRLRLQLY